MKAIIIKDNSVADDFKDTILIRRKDVVDEIKLMQNIAGQKFYAIDGNELINKLQKIKLI